MFEELNVAGNRVLRNSSTDLVIKPLYDQALSEFKSNYEQSIGYPENSNIYIFRTPLNLTGSMKSPGYQWTAIRTENLQRFIDACVDSVSNYMQAKMNVTDAWFLLQDNSNWIDNPIHQHLTASWIATFYVNVNDGDSIKFVDDAGNEEDLFVKNGDFLLFSGTAKHKPNLNAGPLQRISFNMELTVEQDTTESLDRLKICKSCDQLNSINVCQKCFCFMPFKTKIKNAHCPINKW